MKLSFCNESFAVNNYEVCQIINVPFIQIYALHDSKTASYLCYDKMGDLETKLVLPIDARVTSTRKNWTNWRLCNVLIGDVKDVVFKSIQIPPGLLVAASKKFDDYCELSICKDTSNCVSVVLV